MARLKPRAPEPKDDPLLGLFDPHLFVWAVDQTYLYYRKNRAISGLDPTAAAYLINDELRQDMWTQARRFWVEASGTTLFAFPYSVDGVVACYNWLTKLSVKSRKAYRAQVNGYVDTKHGRLR